MSSLQTLQQLEALRDLILQRSTDCMNHAFAIGGVTITPEVEFDLGKYAAYKIAGDQLDALIVVLKKAQAEEAANV